MGAFEQELIYKHDLQSFLQKLKKEARHIYALFTGASIEHVWVCKSKNVQDKYEDKISVKHFLEQYTSFDGKKDLFRLCAKVYYLPDEWKYIPECNSMEILPVGEETFSLDYKNELSVEEVISEAPHILAYICREAIWANKPLSLLDESVKEQYGFKRTDIEKLRDIVLNCNLRITEQLRIEYDRLRSIDCVRNYGL